MPLDPIRHRIAYFDCFNGAAGDMIVGALLDAGADAAQLQAGLGSLNLSGYDLRIERATKQGLDATRYVVNLKDSKQQPHRHLKEVVAIIRGGKLPTSVQESAIRVFERLAEAEAAVHGTSRDKVHFHEVGAVDAILDVVGAVLALELLGVAKVVCSAIPVGSGAVETAHGVLPVPAPATAKLLRNVPVAATDESGELTTPTGAAILTTLAESFGTFPSMMPESIGYGAGTREGRRRPNVLRVVIGAVFGPGDAETDFVVQMETNLDQATPETIGHCIERLLEAGALDAFATPIQMKKSRPGTLLTALAAPDLAEELERMIFAETGTLGVRRQWMPRTTLRRRIQSVQTRFGPIRVKVSQGLGLRQASAEFEDCQKAAAAHRVPLREVKGAAEDAWRLLNAEPDRPQ
jgi:hypothetical protein